MNLNKILYKYLDREGKGYVTIGDGAAVIGTLAFLLCIVAMYIQGTILVIKSFNAGDCMGENCTIFECVCILVHIFGTILVTGVVAARIVPPARRCVGAVCETKIATCERKDGD